MNNFKSAMQSSTSITAGERTGPLPEAALRIERANAGSAAMIDVDRSNQKVLYDLGIRSIESSMEAVAENVTRQGKALAILKNSEQMYKDSHRKSISEAAMAMRGQEHLWASALDFMVMGLVGRLQHLRREVPDECLH